MTETQSHSEAILLTYPQAADLLALSQPTLERLVARKEIPFVRIGRSVRFTRSTLLNWVVSKEEGATDAQ